MLESISQPSDLRSLSLEQLEALCEEIRSFILEKVSKTGGHLSP
ncbi:MAG TPA: 1-deoxy-D-xylulose-5-phosphate synthase N-terminal domain-containing protein, partial [Acidimicrobiia bacterium]|nr:1-deoxy-D-xylulose-5-phosphate synthase N-terminal domain-containing protein [Acidimicrobiia bacterium]